jgi:hypothetical protein
MKAIPNKILQILLSVDSNLMGWTSIMIPAAKRVIEQQTKTAWAVILGMITKIIK